MKKYKIFVHGIVNVVIIAILFGLYLACVPSFTAEYTSAPIYKGNNAQSKVAIMINVYEGGEYVEQILNIMDKYDAKCTFFVGGIWVEKNALLLKKMAEKAEIGNHGYLHKNHAKLNEERNREEIEICGMLVEKITGIKPRLFAPPSGSIGNDMLKACEKLDYKVIMWSKDTIDWRDKDSSLVYQRATKELQNGDFILMHPKPHTVEALPKILDYYAENGFSTATVTELIGEI